MEQVDSFWDFAAGTYRKPGVARACLSLQEQHGVDVNVLLYCCWYGCTRGTMDGPAMERILSFAEPWAENVVRPLRAARTWMKTIGCTEAYIAGEDCMGLREEIKRAEFKAEHLQEDRMQELTEGAVLKHPESTSQIHCTLLNVHAYLRHLEIKLDSASSSELAHIVTAAISGAGLDAVTDSLSATFLEN